MLPHPLSHFLMLWVASLAPRFQKARVPADTAHVFRWAGPLPIQTPGIRRLILRGGCDVLNGDLMFPAIAEIVLIEEGYALLRRDVSQANQSIILVEILILWTRLT